MPIMADLMSSNPFPRPNCGRKTCPLKWMKDGCKTRCYKENINYQASCLKCRETQILNGTNLKEIMDTAYEGESARSLYTRANQHIADYKAKIKQHLNPDQVRREGLQDPPRSSFMWDHWLDKHGTVPSLTPELDFQFRITATFADPLTREVSEACRIIMIKSGDLHIDKREGAAKGGVIVNINQKDEHFAPYNRKTH